MTVKKKIIVLQTNTQRPYERYDYHIQIKKYDYHIHQNIRVCFFVLFKNSFLFLKTENNF